MGIIIGKLRKKKTTYEVLETLDKEIKVIEEYRRNTEQAHKRIVGRFILISVGIYLVTAFLFYFYFFPATFYDRLFYIIPLILAPVIILTVKRVLTWYYKWKIARKQNKLSSLREEKKKMLEKVMETETYKVAKRILEKFAPEPPPRKSTALLASTEFSTPLRPPPALIQPSATVTGGLRQRALTAPHQQVLPAATPAQPVSEGNPSTVARSNTQVVARPPSAMVSSTPLPMPRAILPRERSVFDKMVDYLVGDGPSNRYALICKNCYSHNGMAFREEFEYISFHCCYCYTFNPARKKRPAAPKLEFDLQSPHPRSSSDTSESEKNSPSDTDSEADTLLHKTAAATEASKDPEQADGDTNEGGSSAKKLEEPVPMDVDESSGLHEQPEAASEREAEEAEPVSEVKEVEGTEGEAMDEDGIVKD